MGAIGRRGDKCRSRLRPNLTPQSLGGRLLPCGLQLRGVESNDGRGAREIQGVCSRVVASSGDSNKPTYSSRNVLLRLWKCLSSGVVACGCRCYEGGWQVSISLLCSGYYGPYVLRLRLWPIPLVCTSGREEDLAVSDRLAAEVLEQMVEEAPAEIRGQLEDNLHWIRQAKENRLVVGSQARILYADAEGRTRIALAFNEAIKRGEISAPIVLGRDHHDVSGTDSPYRETSNIYDGSQFCADMAVQNVIGDSFRGATWVSLHNGGGVGWGEVINGGFGMVIDGSADSARHIEEMLLWDVNNGIARRSWARNEGAIFAIKRQMERTPLLKVTLPNLADKEFIEQVYNDNK